MFGSVRLLHDLSWIPYRRQIFQDESPRDYPNAASQHTLFTMNGLQSRHQSRRYEAVISTLYKTMAIISMTHFVRP